MMSLINNLRLGRERDEVHCNSNRDCNWCGDLWLDKAVHLSIHKKIAKKPRVQKPSCQQNLETDMIDLYLVKREIKHPLFVLKRREFFD